MKNLSVLIIVAGAFLLAFGAYKWIQTENAQNKSMAEAQSLLEQTEIPFEHFNPTEGETVGILHIPRLEADLPIVEGTHEDELARGVGHYAGTSYPLQGDQIVLSGHRDTVFRRMGELEIGDVLTIQLSYGEFSYEITETKIVDADDKTIIVPHNEEVLTVTTCYPFSFVGSAPDRYIINAKPVPENILNK